MEHLLFQPNGGVLPHREKTTSNFERLSKGMAWPLPMQQQTMSGSHRQNQCDTKKDLCSLHSSISLKRLLKILIMGLHPNLWIQKLWVEQMIFYPESKLPLFSPVFSCLLYTQPNTTTDTVLFLELSLKGDSNHTQGKLSEIPLKSTGMKYYMDINRLSDYGCLFFQLPKWELLDIGYNMHKP